MKETIIVVLYTIPTSFSMPDSQMNRNEKYVPKVAPTKNISLSNHAAPQAIKTGPRNKKNTVGSPADRARIGGSDFDGSVRAQRALSAQLPT